MNFNPNTPTNINLETVNAFILLEKKLSDYTMELATLACGVGLLIAALLLYIFFCYREIFHKQEQAVFQHLTHRYYVWACLLGVYTFLAITTFGRTCLHPSYLVFTIPLFWWLWTYYYSPSNYIVLTLNAQKLFTIAYGVCLLLSLFYSFVFLTVYSELIIQVGLERQDLYYPEKIVPGEVRITKTMLPSPLEATSGVGSVTPVVCSPSEGVSSSDK